MGEININSFDIQKGHTIEEYRKFFSIPYDKGKLLSFDDDELWLMDNYRKYWAIKGKDKKTKYYALPSRFKAFNDNNHNLPFYHNKKPFAVAMSLIGLCFTSCISSYFIGKSINKAKYIDIDFLDLKRVSEDYNLNHRYDAFNHYSIAQLANVMMAETIYEFDNSLKESSVRDKVTTIGHGTSDTDVVIVGCVHVEVTNAFIQNGDDVLEESISYSDSIMAPKVGKRDYCDGSNVTSHNGRATSPTTITWEKQTCDAFSKEQYMDKVGKNPSQPYLYSITNETVLTDKVYDEDPETGEQHFGNSYKKRNQDGTYEIGLDLHNTKGVAKYVKRMTYLSGKTPNYFKTIHLVFKSDSNFRLISSEVQEEYCMVSMPNHGKMNTKYYYDDEASDIPTNPTSFDYSRYQ